MFFFIFITVAFSQELHCSDSKYKIQDTDGNFLNGSGILTKEENAVIVQKCLKTIGDPEQAPNYFLKIVDQKDFYPSFVGIDNFWWKNPREITEKRVADGYRILKFSFHEEKDHWWYGSEAEGRDVMARASEKDASWFKFVIVLKTRTNYLIYPFQNYNCSGSRYKIQHESGNFMNRFGVLKEDKYAVIVQKCYTQLYKCWYSSQSRYSEQSTTYYLKIVNPNGYSNYWIDKLGNQDEFFETVKPYSGTFVGIDSYWKTSPEITEKRVGGGYRILKFSFQKGKDHWWHGAEGRPVVAENNEENASRFKFITVEPRAKTNGLVCSEEYKIQDEDGNFFGNVLGTFDSFGATNESKQVVVKKCVDDQYTDPEDASNYFLVSSNFGGYYFGKSKQSTVGINQSWKHVTMIHEEKRGKQEEYRILRFPIEYNEENGAGLIHLYADYDYISDKNWWSYDKKIPQQIVGKSTSDAAKMFKFVPAVKREMTAGFNCSPEYRMKTKCGEYLGSDKTPFIFSANMLRTSTNHVHVKKCVVDPYISDPEETSNYYLVSTNYSKYYFGGSSSSIGINHKWINSSEITEKKTGDGEYRILAFSSESEKPWKFSCKKSATEIEFVPVDSE